MHSQDNLTPALAGTHRPAITRENLPLEILNSCRAVIWKREIRDGRETKVPYQPRRPDQRAAVDNPDSWATFDEALSVYADGKADGAGLVLGEGLVGVDLDHCRDPDTGVVDEESLAIVKQLDSYTEISPSETGLHVLMRGKLPDGRRRKGPIEMYSELRYFTITGRHLEGTPSGIEERSARLADLHRKVFFETQGNDPLPPHGRVRLGSSDDSALIERAHAAANGVKFATLWRGDFSGYPSQSEADQALGNLLAFWTDRDAERIDRLFRQSGLFRPKWDERRGARTYGERTIARAVESGADARGEARADTGVPAQPNREQAGSNEARLVPFALNLRQLLELKIPVREFILEPILKEKESAMVHAWRGVGKTQVAANIAYAVARGGSFLRWRSPSPRRVLYIDGEMPIQTMQERLAAIVAADDGADDFEPSNLEFICADLQDTSLPDLSTPEGQAFYEPFAEKAELIIVDSISTLARVSKENEAEPWLPLQDWALALRRRGKTLMLFHHDGKNGLQRGTSRKEDILDLIIQLRRPKDYEPSQGARFEVHFEKNRGVHGTVVDPFEAHLTVDAGRAVWATRQLEEAQAERAAALKADGCKVADIAQELSVSRATVYRLLDRTK